MKSMTYFVLIAAAAMGQIAKADMAARFTAPFEFATSTAKMPSGKYQLEVRNVGTSTKVLLLRHETTDHRNLFLASSGEKIGAPRIEFYCAEQGACMLYRVALRGMVFTADRGGKHGDRRLYTIYLKQGKVNAD